MRPGPSSPISSNDQVAYYDPGLGAGEIDEVTPSKFKSGLEAAVGGSTRRRNRDGLTRFGLQAATAMWRQLAGGRILTERYRSRVDVGRTRNMHPFNARQRRASRDVTRPYRIAARRGLDGKALVLSKRWKRQPRLIETDFPLHPRVLSDFLL